MAFSVATGLVLSEQAEKSSDLGTTKTIANLRAVQSLVEAQQAAMIACMTSVVAASVATSGS